MEDVVQQMYKLYLKRITNDSKINRKEYNDKC
jgi:hypothetical protein